MEGWCLEDSQVFRLEVEWLWAWGCQNSWGTPVGIEDVKRFLDIRSTAFLLLLAFLSFVAIHPSHSFLLIIVMITNTSSLSLSPPNLAFLSRSPSGPNTISAHLLTTNNFTH